MEQPGRVELPPPERHSRSVTVRTTASVKRWSEQRDSNSHDTVWKTGFLPQEYSQILEPPTGVAPALSCLPCTCPSPGTSTASIRWWTRGESNPLPHVCQTSALPAELRAHCVAAWWTETDSNRRHYRARVVYSRLYYRPITIELAGREGIEPSRTGFGGQSVAVTLRPMFFSAREGSRTLFT